MSEKKINMDTRKAQIKKLSATSRFFVVLICIALPIVLGVSAYFISARLDRLFNPFVDPEYRATIELQVKEQQEKIEQSRQYMRNHMEALTNKLGALQAQITRLQAIEARIIKETHIDIGKTEKEVYANKKASDSHKHLDDAITEIEAQLSESAKDLAILDFIIFIKNQKNAKTPIGWPVKSRWISSKFGVRMHPINGKRHFHRGVDIPAEEGVEIIAVAPGVVSKSKKDETYGWLVEIDHSDGYKTLYAHNRENRVTVGDAVVRGQTIAIIGSSGTSTGSHVHFEVYKYGKRVNPVRYLYKKF